MHDIIVIGGGPAGLTAALYALRAGKSVLVIEKSTFGGQITWSPKVENFPGIPSVSGAELGDKFTAQALDQGAELELDEVTSVELDGDIKRVKTDFGGTFEAKALIIASGARPRTLGIPGEEESLKFGIVGGIAHPQVDMNLVNYDKKPWTAEPTQQISYVSCHDDMCLVDRLKATVPGIKDASRTESERIAELIRLDLLAQTAVFTSQGVPFFLAGEEMLRDKKGVHNSYCSPDSINEFNWENLKKYPQVFEYYRNLIQLRKNHPAFRLAKAEAVREHLEFLPTTPVAEQKKDGAQVEKNGCLLAFRLKNLEGIDSWKNIIVIFNANKEARTIAIPQGEYHVACCNGVINEDGIGMPLVGNETIIDGQSALILYQK